MVYMCNIYLHFTRIFASSVLFFDRSTNVQWKIKQITINSYSTIEKLNTTKSSHSLCYIRTWLNYLALITLSRTTLSMSSLKSFVVDPGLV